MIEEIISFIRVAASEAWRGRTFMHQTLTLNNGTRLISTRFPMQHKTYLHIIVLTLIASYKRIRR